MRMPVAYSVSRMARSRSATGSSPSTAPSNASTSGSVSAFGSPWGRQDVASSSVGWFARSSSSTQNRCSDRTATRRLTIVAGA